MTTATVKTIEEDSQALGNPAATHGTDRFERASWFSHNPVPRKMSLDVSPGNQRRS